MLPWALLALVLASVSPTSAVDENPSTNTQSLLWGPYRPNIYLGLRPRVPKSVIAGLMWARLEDVGTSKLRLASVNCNADKLYSTAT